MFAMSESVRVEHEISPTPSAPLGLCSLCVFAAGRQGPVRWLLPRASTQSANEGASHRTATIG